VTDALLNQQGSPKYENTNKIILSLVGIQEDRIGHSVEYQRRQSNGAFQQKNPEVKLNLYLLFAINTNDSSSENSSTHYKTMLKLLSYVVSFFQAHYFLTPQNSPGLDENIEKLIFELQSLTFEQQNYLWGSIGTKYSPSVLYRVRLISIEDDATAPELPGISALELSETDSSQ